MIEGMGMPKVAASILSADFSRLKAEVEKAESAGVDLIHLDVMDGRFVDNATFDHTLVAKVDSWTSLPLDVHLMVADPGNWVQPMVEAGADYITIHYEACPEPRTVLSDIRRRGARAGIAVNPDTPTEQLASLFPEIDLLLIMSVQPGRAGQEFDRRVLAKMAETKRQIRAAGYEVELEVDGGVKPELARQLIEAGADILVAATAIFQADDMRRAIAGLKDEDV
jgi:ribulose-phosphate 3-epimerase